MQGNLIKVYYYWCAEFAIVLHSHDNEILELIKEKFGVGSLSFAKGKQQVRYSVQDTKDLYEVIVPFFDRVPLIGIKRKDYTLWGEAVKLIFLHQQKRRVGSKKPLDSLTEEKLQDLKAKVDLHKHG